MAELKTKPTGDDVAAFLAGIEDPTRKDDAIAVNQLMEAVAGGPGQMWGETIVGFVPRHLKYESGREVDWFTVGFSPRKNNLTLYLTEGFESYNQLLSELGPHSIGKSCLYIKKLANVDVEVLTKLITESVKQVRDESSIDQG
jgi:hypothetical protein